MSGWAKRRSLTGMDAAEVGGGHVAVGGLVGLAARGRRGGGLRILVGLQRLGGRLGRGLVLGHRVVLGDGAQVRVAVTVAVHVLEHDVVAELRGGADLLDLAVVGGDHRRARARVDVDLAAVVVRLDDVGGVLAALHALDGFGFLEVVGVAGACCDGEAAFGQAGERADEVGRDAGDQACAQQDGVDVPVGVVVGKDRLTDRVLVAGGLQITGGGEDRVDGVVRILLAVLVRIRAIHPPSRGDELHPPQRTGRRHVQVAAVIGLDLIDRRQHLPTNPVLDTRRLVDRQQEHRHTELADHEIRHTLRNRRTRKRVHEPRVRSRRRTIRIAQRSLTRALARAGRTLTQKSRVGRRRVVAVLRLGLGLVAGRVLLAAALLDRAVAHLRRRALLLIGRWRGGGRRRGRRGRAREDLQDAGKLDVGEIDAGGEVDRERDDLAVEELDGQGALLSGSGQRERRKGSQGCQSRTKQEIQKPLLHPCVLFPPRTPLDETPLAGRNLSERLAAKRTLTGVFPSRNWEPSGGRDRPSVGNRHVCIG